MARLSYRPIGHPLPPGATIPDDTQRAHCHVAQARDEINRGWGESYDERVKKKNKLTTRERLQLLADPGTALLPIGTFVNHGRHFGKPPRTAPAAGVITAFAVVHQRYIVVIANDNTVASGAWWPQSPEKIQRAQQIALRLRLPVIYLVDCSGLFLPEQANTFPGALGAGRIFKQNAELSAAGVPQLAAVMGDCIAGGAYMPIISDKVFMTEQAYMVIAGAALIKGAKSQAITSHTIGGPNVHVHRSLCADQRVPDDPAAIAHLRREIAKLPTSAVPFYRQQDPPLPSPYPAQDLYHLLPADHTRSYDMRQVLARLLDGALFAEVLPERGQEIITGIGHISGLALGIVANDPELTADPDRPGQSRPGAILYRDGIDKTAAFVRACDDDGLPILWLQDVAGFDVGPDAESQGLLGHGSNLLYTIATLQVPVLTVLLRKASGAGYYAMAGRPFDPVLQLATPLTRLAVMEGRTLAIGAFHTKLDDHFEIATTDPQERATIAAAMHAVEAQIESDMDPLRAAANLDVDELVDLAQIPAYLNAMLQMCYQSTGHRRIKNRRIWSLNTLALYPPTARPCAAADLEPAPPPPHHCPAQDEILVCAPIDGLFFRRPNPDAPAYLNPGETAQPGAVLGLIEVMKLYYEVRFQPANGHPARLVTCLAEDAVAVTAGTPLFALRRLDSQPVDQV